MAQPAQLDQQAQLALLEQLVSAIRVLAVQQV
jgi:hypothetical protein